MAEGKAGRPIPSSLTLRPASWCKQEVSKSGSESTWEGGGAANQSRRATLSPTRRPVYQPATPSHSQKAQTRLPKPSPESNSHPPPLRCPHRSGAPEPCQRLSCTPFSADLPESFPERLEQLGGNDPTLCVRPQQQAEGRDERVLPAGPVSRGATQPGPKRKCTGVGSAVA